MIKRPVKFLAAIGILLVAFLAACSGIFERGSSVVPDAQIPPIDTYKPTEIATATFALGWFWGPDSRFGSIKGVVRTRVGYAGGTTENPTYYKLGDHSETVQIDYDPNQISYHDLLDVFWDSHDPTMPPWSSRQYMSIVFYHNEEQQKLAMATKAREEARIDSKIVTEIVPFTGFYLAEAYHQKYYLQQVPVLMKELSVAYPDTDDFVASTVVTRLNGYTGGYGTQEALQEDLSSFGLSAEGNKKLLEIAGRGLSPACAIPWITSS